MIFACVSGRWPGIIRPAPWREHPPSDAQGPPDPLRGPHTAGSRPLGPWLPVAAFSFPMIFTGCQSDEPWGHPPSPVAQASPELCPGPLQALVGTSPCWVPSPGSMAAHGCVFVQAEIHQLPKRRTTGSSAQPGGASIPRVMPGALATPCGDLAMLGSIPWDRGCPWLHFHAGRYPCDFRWRPSDG